MLSKISLTDSKGNPNVKIVVQYIIKSEKLIRNLSKPIWCRYIKHPYNAVICLIWKQMYWLHCVFLIFMFIML